MTPPPVLKAGTRVRAGGRNYRRARLTLDTTTLEPDVTELKFYAPGVGTVLTLDLSPDRGSSWLVRMIRP